MSKERLSATVESALLAAGRQAVSEGRAESLSAWVNEALHRQSEHERRLRALDAFLATYEGEHGEITDEEMEAASRDARTRAVVVRARSRPDRRDATRKATGAQ